MTEMNKNSEKRLISERKNAANRDNSTATSAAAGGRQTGSLETAIKSIDGSDSYKVYEALTLVKSRITKHPSEIVRFRHLGGIDKLVGVLPTINPKFLGSILSILGNCCTEEKSCYKIAQCDGIKALGDRVLQLLTTDNLRNRFCRLIGSLAAHDSCCILIHDEPEIIKSIVGFLTEETENECRQAVGKAIRILCDNESHQQSVLEWQAVKAVALLLKVEDIGVIMQTLKTVSHFMKRCTDRTVEQLVSGETIQSLVALSLKNENTEIMRYSKSLLLKIASIQNFRPYLGFNGGVELFIQGAELLLGSLTTLSSRSLRQLYHFINAICLCCRDCANRIKILEFGGLELLVRVLQSERLSHIFDRVISSLVYFNYYVDGLEALLSSAGIFNVLVSHMYRCMEAESNSSSGSVPVVEESQDADRCSVGDANSRDDAEDGEFEDLGEINHFLPLNQDLQNEDLSIAAPHATGGDEAVEVNIAMETGNDKPEETTTMEMADEEVAAINDAIETNGSTRQINGQTRYSIHSPTYQAILSETKLEDIEPNPRNMWEGVEMYGGYSNGCASSSPSLVNSPVRLSSAGSSPVHEPYSPMSVCSYGNSDSVSDDLNALCDRNLEAERDSVLHIPRSDELVSTDGRDLESNRELLLHILGSDEMVMSPEDQATDGGVLPPTTVYSEFSSNNSGSSSISVSHGVLATQDSATASLPAADDPSEDLQLYSGNQFDDDANSFSQYKSETFRKNRRFAAMLLKYEGAFMAPLGAVETEELPPPTPSTPQKGEKRKRSLSAEALRKIQKTVEGDIARSSRSRIDLDEMVSKSSSPDKRVKKAKKMSPERVTIINILTIFWRALDLGNSNESLYSKKVIQAILDFIGHMRYSSGPGSRMLLRLVGNPLCFEMLIRNGIPSVFHETLSSNAVLLGSRPTNKDSSADPTSQMNVTDGSDAANECSGESEDSQTGDVHDEFGRHSDLEKAETKRLKLLKKRSRLCENLFDRMSAVAQTPFGQGVVSRLLRRRASHPEKEKSAIELCYIARSRTMRNQYLLQMGGLKLLIGILGDPQSTLFSSALHAVCLLAKQLPVSFVHRKPDADETTGCAEERFDAPDDVMFVLENGDVVGANRAEMAASSAAFSALLEGHFAESAMSQISIRCASTKAFQFLIKMIRNESIQSAIESLNQKTVSIPDLLTDVLRLANQFLLPDICDRVGTYICARYVSEENIEDVFGMCFTMNCISVCHQCIGFIIDSTIPLHKTCHMMSRIIEGNWLKEFLDVFSCALTEALRS